MPEKQPVNCVSGCFLFITYPQLPPLRFYSNRYTLYITVFTIINIRLILIILLVIAAAIFTSVVVYKERFSKKKKYNQSILLELLDALPLGCLLVDDDYRIIFTNNCMRQWRILPESGVFPDHEWGKQLQKDMALNIKKEETNICRSHINIDPNRQVKWWVIRWDARILVIIQDITYEKQLEQQSGLFLSTLSHELRTPIATILTHLEVLGLSNLSEDIRRESLGILKAETQRMSRMVNGMIKLGRIETDSELVELLPVDIVKVAETAVSQLLQAAENKEMRIYVKVIPPVSPVRGNRDYMMQVFYNLIDNGIKYSETGGKIDITIECENESIVCSIKDSGIGIAPEHIEHLAEYFYRVAPNQHDGSGLGLAIVKEILKKHHSELEIESRTEGEERGTIVRFRLRAIVN